MKVLTIFIRKKEESWITIQSKTTTQSSFHNLLASQMTGK